MKCILFYAIHVAPPLASRGRSPKMDLREMTYPHPCFIWTDKKYRKIFRKVVNNTIYRMKYKKNILEYVTKSNNFIRQRLALLECFVLLQLFH